MTALRTLPAALVEALPTIRSVGVITGAGISAESGIPTYRGKGGVYDDPDEGDRTIEALSGHTLRHDPDLTWRTFGHILRHSAGAEPNPAHRALVEIEARVERFVLLTQNVDRLHRLAGSRNIIDIHGDGSSTVCLECGDRAPLDPTGSYERAPRCEACSGILRPDVVLFGEMLPMDKLQRLRREFFQHVPDLVLAIGTSALFPYICEPVSHAALLGRLTVEVNTEETALSHEVRWSLRGPAGEWLPLVAEAIARRA